MRKGGVRYRGMPSVQDSRYGNTCGIKKPQFAPQHMIIPPKGGVTVEGARVMGMLFAQSLAPEIQQMMVALGDVDQIDGIPITKAFIGLTVSIGTSATQIVVPDKKRSYLIVNPASETLGSTTDEIIATASTITANGTSAVIDVAGVEDLHIFFEPTAITGRWKIWLQAKNPVTGDYADTQLLFDTADADIAANTESYAYVGSHGIASSARFRYEEVSAGSLTFNLGITRKKNVGSLDVSTGVPRTVYLGNSGVTTSSGYPLLEGAQDFFIIDQNVDLHGVAQTTTDLKLFQLEV